VQSQVLPVPRTQLSGAELREDVAARLVAAGGLRSEFLDQVSITVGRNQLVAAVELARQHGFVLLSDIFGIDWLEYPRHQGERFTVVYNLAGIDGTARIFIRTDLADGVSLPTITHLWLGANFMEREVFDMFGVTFDGHPDLRKLLTPEDLVGHPHRKDFPIGETPTLFNDGRFLDPATFRAGLMGRNPGLTGWRGGARRGVISTQERPAEPADIAEAES
jgi:NADH-quinone oxidoreductase subunit C